MHLNSILTSNTTDNNNDNDKEIHLSKNYNLANFLKFPEIDHFYSKPAENLFLPFCNYSVCFLKFSYF